ncbi:MAG: DinB family protein [Chloroflexota bacterium]
MLEFETRKNDCPLCGTEIDMPADMFGTMAEMPKLVSRSFREPRSLSGVGWTPHEVASHLADVEVVLGWRIRQILIEDEPMLIPFDQDKWGRTLFYGARELATSLSTYAANRQSNLELLRLAGDTALERGYRHPEFGNRPLRTLIEHIADHDIAHLKQVRGIE